MNDEQARRNMADKGHYPRCGVELELSIHVSHDCYLEFSYTCCCIKCNFEYEIAAMVSLESENDGEVDFEGSRVVVFVFHYPLAISWKCRKEFIFEESHCHNNEIMHFKSMLLLKEILVKLVLQRFRKFIPSAIGNDS